MVHRRLRGGRGIARRARAPAGRPARRGVARCDRERL